MADTAATVILSLLPFFFASSISFSKRRDSLHGRDSASSISPLVR